MLNRWMKAAGAGVVAALALILIACNGGEADDGKPKVIATIFPYYDIVRAVGGDKIHAEMLLDPNAEVHDYQASPADRDRIDAAKLVVKNGLGLDDWTVLKGTKANVLVIGDGVGTAMGNGNAAPAAGIVNPHVWLDPVKQMKATELVRDALIKMDPANKATYDANAEKYLADLKKLDADFAAATKSFGKKSFIGFHEAYAYLAARYGLDQAASLEEADKSGLTPAQVDHVIALIKSGKATVLFSEDQASKEKVDKIVQQTGAVTGVLLPLETCSDRSQTYVGLMRQNLEVLQATMK
jgi:ABC-type Zn uptake system ZnuABC Zn-binding protein ZnuA